jgi:hypothetical protein
VRAPIVPGTMARRASRRGKALAGKVRMRRGKGSWSDVALPNLL